MYCIIESRGQTSNVKTLKLSLIKIEKLNLIKILFGSNHNEVYITGYQLTKLASKLYSELNIKDEYEISENAFAEEFIHKLILISNNLFNITDLTGSELN